MDIREIGIKELLKLNNPLIIDIRSHNSFLEEHIPNSVNIPYFELIIEYPKKLRKDIVYYICCEEGQKAREVVNYLYLKGYKAVNIIGGYEAYKNYRY